MTIRDLKIGEYFTLKPIEDPKETQVYVRGDYLKVSKVFQCHKFSDVNSSRYFNPETTVYTDFTF